MPRLLAIFFTAAIGLCLPGLAFSAAKKAPSKVQIDTSKVITRRFDANALSHFKKDSDFNYDTNNPTAGQPSLWQRFWSWLWNTISDWFQSVPYGGTILKYVFLALAVALLLYVILKSLDIDPIKLMRGEAKKINVPYNESVEDIHEIDFEKELDKAVSQQNFRLAVRLLYLNCLKQLSDANLIQWQIDKTNLAYVHELADPVKKQTFALLTRRFEYVWYGSFAIDKQAFGTINRLFQNFKDQQL
jgi:ABC-type dipeptide/oligopeptide/nickel transport system permease component